MGFHGDLMGFDGVEGWCSGWLWRQEIGKVILDGPEEIVLVLLQVLEMDAFKCHLETITAVFMVVEWICWWDSTVMWLWTIMDLDVIWYFLVMHRNECGKPNAFFSTYYWGDDGYQAFMVILVLGMVYYWLGKFLGIWDDWKIHQPTKQNQDTLGTRVFPKTDIDQIL